MTKKGTNKALLGFRKAKAVEALITCDTIEEACDAIGIGRTTMYRYFKDPEFDNELKSAKRQLMNRAVMKLQQTCTDAARALAEICRDKNAPASARVSAAREIINSSLRAIELEDLEARLERLEQVYVR